VFKLMIRTGKLYNRDGFQAQVKERLPLMVGGAMFTSKHLLPLINIRVSVLQLVPYQNLKDP